MGQTGARHMTGPCKARAKMHANIRPASIEKSVSDSRSGAIRARLAIVSGWPTDVDCLAQNRRVC